MGKVLTVEQQEFVDSHSFSQGTWLAIAHINRVLASKGDLISYMDVIDSIALILSADATAAQKKAAKVTLMYVFSVRFINDLVEDVAVVTDRGDSLVYRWRKRVLERDHYTCRRCGSKEHVVAHHIAYWSEDPVNRVSVDNGLTLCNRCHAKAHWGERVYNLLAKKCE